MLNYNPGLGARSGDGRRCGEVGFLLGEVRPPLGPVLSKRDAPHSERQNLQQRVGVRELSEGRPGQSQARQRGETAAQGDEGGRGRGAHREAEEAHGEQPGFRG